MVTRSSRKWGIERLFIHTDDKGSLVVLESGREVRFPLQRVYFLFGTPNGVERGSHAHRRNEQIAVAAAGTCTFVLDDGDIREEVRLDKPHAGLFMAPMVWHELKDFSADCVLLVLASESYDEQEYIRDYDEFRSVVEGAGKE